MNRLPRLLAGVLALVVLLILSGACFTVRETEIVILTQFGGPVGAPITDAGLHWKTPFVQEVHRIDKRVLEFDGPATRMPTRDKTYIEVDTFARWRIVDAAKWFVMLRDERTTQSRLEDILGGETRSAIASHDLIEVVRSDIARQAAPVVQEQGVGTSPLRAAKRGRLGIEADILKAAAPSLLPFGIELIDVRIKRVNYNTDVLTPIHQRMISERLQIAQRFRSEGEGEAARIVGKKERELRTLESEAYRQVQEIRGAADAEASRVYAEAYDRTPEAREFYTFLKTLDTWRSVLGRQSRLVLSTDSELFRLLKQSGR